MAQNANQQLLDLLVTKNFEPQTLDSQGKPAPTPDQASVFSFDYKGESGKDYGTVVVMVTDGELTVYSGDNTGKAMEGDDKNAWFSFLQQLKNFAVGHFMSFGSQNLNKLKYSMQGQAALKEGLFEGWSGNKTNSWNGKVTEARLMIKHKKTIGENDARYRYIESLFIETAEGERFKLPFTKLSGGKAMLEHVRQGGKPYDIRGNHIVTIVTEMNLLNRFRRASQNKIFEGETAQLVEQATHYYESLQHNLKSLSSKTGYKKYFESWDPTAITDEDVIIEDLRHMFVEQNIDTRIEQALPLLAKLKQQDNTMKEADIFESMMNLITEGTWSLPDTKEKQAALVTLLSQELPVGADATNATEQLYDLLGDDDLFNQLHSLAQEDANADARTIIINRLEQLKDNPAVAQVIGKIKIEHSPAADKAQPEEPAPQPPESVESPVAEDNYEMTMESIQRAAGLNEYIDRVKLDPKTGKPTEWSHEGDWEKTPKRNGKPVDPHGEVTNMAGKELQRAKKIADIDEVKDPRTQTEDPPNTSQPKVTPNKLEELSPDTLKSYIKKAGSSSDERSASNLASRAAHKLSNPEGDDDGNWDDEKSYMRSKGIAKAVDRLEESGMSEVDLLLQDIARGDVDIYNVYANPKSNVEKFVSNQIHEKYDDIVAERGLHPDDDVEQILQIIQDQLATDHGVDEGTIGKAIGAVAGTALAPEIPGSGVIGGMIGDKIGDKISPDEETDESAGGGNFLEVDMGQADRSLRAGSHSIEDGEMSWTYALKQAAQQLGFDHWSEAGEDDLLKIQSLARKIRAGEDHEYNNRVNTSIAETTTLQGQYGHSGKMEAVKPQDQDMMDRIKFLAGLTK